MTATRTHRRRFRRSAINFAAINETALSHVDTILQRWLPEGRREGQEWVALNPLRDDRRLGSFRINIASGKWADYATGDAGGDLISFAAYLTGTRQGVAARNLTDMLVVRHDYARRDAAAGCGAGAEAARRRRTKPHSRKTLKRISSLICAGSSLPSGNA